MLKVTDVDLIADYTLTLRFSDGFQGQADLRDCFSKPPFSAIADFRRFALTAEGTLRWSNNELSAASLRTLSKGRYVTSPCNTAIPDMENIIKQAAWDSMLEGRPDILQAAIRDYVEQFGHRAVIEKAGIKSRTSAYKSLKPATSPSFGTLVQLGHAVIELARESEQQRL